MRAEVAEAMSSDRRCLHTPTNVCPASASVSELGSTMLPRVRAHVCMRSSKQTNKPYRKTRPKDANHANQRTQTTQTKPTVRSVQSEHRKRPHSTQRPVPAPQHTPTSQRSPARIVHVPLTRPPLIPSPNLPTSPAPLAPVPTVTPPSSRSPPRHSSLPVVHLRMRRASAPAKAALGTL